MTDPTTPHDENTDALYSLFCGAVAVATSFFGIGALFGVIAVVLGWRGLERSYEGQGRRGWAIGGITLGMIAILVVATWLIGRATD